MQPFSEIRKLAVERHGQAGLRRALGEPPRRSALTETSDDRYLSLLTRCVFQAGFVWKVVEHKWPGFERAFSGFEPRYWAQAADERLEELASDPAIIRNLSKIRSVRDNAAMIVTATAEHGSFGRFLAQWPADDQVGLMAWLARHGSRLGGMTAQYFLRFAGWDSYILSRDVVAALIRAGVIDRPPTSKAAMAEVQSAFNQWHRRTRRCYVHLSRILALSIDA